MTSVHSVLVVGGGSAGCALATLLGRGGVAVEIVERKPDFTVYGSGITLQGAALRVLREVGVWDELRRYGYEFDSLGIRSADGQLLAEIPDARSGGPDLPATMGAYRPKLAELLADAAVDAGAKVRLGTTVESFTQDDDGVDVVFSDGDTGRYDLLVGADGVRSQTRRQLGIDVAPQPVGMGIWRVHAGRPAEVTRTDLVYDGPCYIAGYCPTGPDTLYAYLVEKSQDRFADTPEQKVAAMRELADAYHGPWDEIREDITDPERINYTLFEHVAHRRAVEPRPGRGHRRRRARLPAHPGARRGDGPGRRLRPGGAAAHPRPCWTRTCSTPSLARRLARAKAVVDGSMQLRPLAAGRQDRRRRPRPDGRHLRPDQPTRLMTRQPAGRLAGKVALITGTGGGQGRAAALLSPPKAPPSSAATSKPRARKPSSSSPSGVAGWTAPTPWTSPTKPPSATGSTAPPTGTAASTSSTTTPAPPASTPSRTSPTRTGVHPSQRTRRRLPGHQTRLAAPPARRRIGHPRRFHRRAHRIDDADAGRSHRDQRRGHRADPATGRRGRLAQIRVNCISPGMVMTPATQDDIFGDPDHPMYRIRDHIPLGRIGTPTTSPPAHCFSPATNRPT